MSETPEIASAFEMMIQGIRLMGDSITIIINYVLVAFGIVVPKFAIQVGALITVVLALWKFNNVMNRITLYAVLLLVFAMFAGLLGTASDAITAWIP